MRTLLGALLFASTAAAFAGGCSAAHADRVYVPSSSGARIALGIAPAKLRAPYDVQVIRENGEQLPTYGQRDRFYVQGNVGERYTIRITNPTPNRVEAVVTVDGLDVIDGENGDLRKRGYVVPAYGDVRIEGFRTSQADVATFRFSSVGESYAGKKGKARNVGVVAVAIFEENAPEPDNQIIVGGGGYGGYQPPYDFEDDISSRAPSKDSSRGETVGSRDRAPAPPPQPGRVSKRAPAEAPSSTGGSAPRQQRFDEGDSMEEEWVAPKTTQRNRPGLGTEYGESRYSAASFTRFVRANNRPIAIAELRYNDFAGLVALGIHAQPLPDEREIMTRETADPFPGDHTYSRPPR
ncbi:MAG: hypothetical protein M4D80_42510 [Myxococcota bacterium]|nr:hypothetical protein [Myxococcota bacterium]